MSKLIKVEGFNNLVRDEYSNAIINTNKTEYEKYMARKKAMQKNRDEIRGAVREINNIKKELYDIKKLITDFVGKK
jgi:hypothetical protein